DASTLSRLAGVKLRARAVVEGVLSGLGEETCGGPRGHLRRRRVRAASRQRGGRGWKRPLRPSALLGHEGGRTASSNRSISFTLVSPSDSAVKFGSTRCRSTGR